MAWRGSNPSIFEDQNCDMAQKQLSDAAKRALKEAEARRIKLDQASTTRLQEINGRKDGLDPARYGDWEKNGIASDF